MSETDEPGTELCGETYREYLPPCGLVRGHGGLHLSQTVPTCAAVLHLHADHACTLPQGHSERHKDSDGDEWDITWTRPQSARMEAPSPPLTFSRDRRLRALEEFQDSATSRMDWIQQCAKEAGDRRDEELDDIRTRLEALENGTSRRINIHDFDRIMGRVTATLDAIGPRLGLLSDRTRLNDLGDKLDRILERLGPPDVERCGAVRPYSGSAGPMVRVPDPDDMCVRPEGHTDRHVSGNTSWPNTVAHIPDRCGVQDPESGRQCWERVGPNIQPHTVHRTAYGAVWESERTHDEGCEREPEHGAECCSHPNGFGPNGCSGCGDYRPDEPDDPKCVNGCQRANGHVGICCGHSGGLDGDNRCVSGCGDRLT
jgi:hypothetical protein